MKTYETWFYGYGGDGNDFQGYFNYEFSNKQLSLVKESMEEGYENFEDDDRFDNLCPKLISCAAEFAMNNFEEAYEVYQQFGGRGITHKAAMIRYLKDQNVSFPFPAEMIDDLEEDEEE